MIDRERFDYVTFDCYGTLVDWESGIVEALGPVLEAHSRWLDRRILLSTYAELEASITVSGISFGSENGPHT